MLVLSRGPSLINGAPWILALGFFKLQNKLWSILDYETKYTEPETTIQSQECVQRWGREARWVGNSLEHTPDLFQNNIFCTFPFCKNKGLVQHSSSDLHVHCWFGDWVATRKGSRSDYWVTVAGVWTADQAAACSKFTAGTILRSPVPGPFPPPQQLTLDAHTHLNGLSWNQNSHTAVQMAGHRGLWTKWPTFKSWSCLSQAKPKSLYFSVPQFPLVCMMEESQGLIGQSNSCLTVLSTRRRDDTIPQSQTNLSKMNTFSWIKLTEFDWYGSLTLLVKHISFLITYPLNFGL